MSTNTVPIELPRYDDNRHDLPSEEFIFDEYRLLTGTSKNLPQYLDFQTDPSEVVEDQHQIIKENVRERRLNSIKRTISRLLLVNTLFSGAYAYDVADVDTQLANTHPAIVHVYDSASPEHEDTMVIVMAGLGNRSAFATARALPTYDRIGDVEAIIYDNKGVDPASIAKLIIDKSKAEDKTSVILDGHSMGGLVATAVAADIYSSDSGLKVKDVILDCTPESYSAVRENQRTTADTTLNLASFVPGSLKSRSLRFAAEMYARRSNYVYDSTLSINSPALVESAKQVINDKFLSDDAASGVLLGSQLGLIRDSNMAENLRTLSDKGNGKTPPRIFFQQPRDVYNDPVVDDDYSRQSIEELTAQDGLTFYTYYTDGGHANPIQAPDTYNNIAASIAVVVNEIPKANPSASSLSYREIIPAPSSRLTASATPTVAP